MITRTDLTKNVSRFATYKQLMEMYSLGMNTVVEMAREAGAVYKIGHKVLVSTEIFEAYFETFRVPGNNEAMLRCLKEKK